MRERELARLSAKAPSAEQQAEAARAIEAIRREGKRVADALAPS